MAGGYLLGHAFYTQAFEKNQTLHEWYSHYYLHRDRKQVVTAINYFLADNFPAAAVRKKALQGFFSTLFREYPEQAVDWINESRLSKNERRPLLIALSQAGMKKAARRLAQHDGWSKDELHRLDQGALSVITPPNAVRASDIGWLWGAFKASGDTRHLDRIFDILIFNTDQQNRAANESLQTVIIQTLQYHRANDSLVDEHYQQRYTGMPTAIQEELDILFAAFDEGDGEADCE